MIGRIARKEILEARRDRRWLVALVLTWLLFSAALASGWQELRTARQQRAMAQHNERERWLNQGETSPHDATHHGLYVFALPSPLAAFDPGVRSFTGEAAFLEGDHPVTFLFRPAADAPAAHKFGEWSVAVIWQTLLPLVIILLTYGVFAREREAGTLRQLLSLGVPVRTLAAGKLLGTAGTLLLMAAPFTVIVAIGLAQSGLSGVTGDEWRRALLLTLTCLVWFSIVLLMSLTVSALASSSRLALGVLLLFWFFNALFSPPLAASLAQWLRPTPSALEFANALRRQERDTRQLNNIMAEIEARLLKEYGVASVAELPVNPKGVALLEIEAEKTLLQQRQFDRLQQAFAQQGLICQAASFLAPQLAMQTISMSLAGSDAAHYLHFARAAEHYRRDLVRRMNEDDAQHRKPDMVPYLPNLRGRDLWESVPPFQYEPPSLGWALKTIRWSGIALLVWGLLLTGCAAIAVRRMNVG